MPWTFGRVSCEDADRSREATPPLPATSMSNLNPDRGKPLLMVAGIAEDLRQLPGVRIDVGTSPRRVTYAEVEESEPPWNASRNGRPASRPQQLQGAPGAGWWLRGASRSTKSRHRPGSWLHARTRPCRGNTPNGRPRTSQTRSLSGWKAVISQTTRNLRNARSAGLQAASTGALPGLP